MSLNLKRRCRRRLGLPLHEYLRRAERYRLSAEVVAEVLSAPVRLVLWWCRQYGVHLGSQYVWVGCVLDTKAGHLRRAGLCHAAVRGYCEHGMTFAQAVLYALYRKALRVGRL